jgi:hypothetical protein
VSRGTTETSGAKTASSLAVDGLPSGTNHFVVRTFTPAHTNDTCGATADATDFNCISDNNPNDLTSAYSAEASAVILADTSAPTVTDVRVDLRDGGQVGSAAVTLSWSAADDVTPVQDLVFRTQVRRLAGGSWTRWGRTRTIYRLRSLPVLPLWRTFQYRVRARDANGNWGAWVESNTIRPIRRQERHFKLIGDWSVAGQAGAMKGKVARTTSAGASARLVFVGDGVALVGPTGPGLGTLEACVDPGTAAQECVTVDLASMSPTGQRRFVATFADLGHGRHVLRVTATSGQVDLDGAVLSR